MHRTAPRSTRTGSIVSLAVLGSFLLTGCVSTPEADPDAWATALEEVPGVTSADVEFTEFTSGESADVDVYTDTNDPAELEGILRDSLRQFVTASEDMSTFGLDFSVWRSDRTAGLDPESIGWNGTTIGFLRDDVAADSGG